MQINNKCYIKENVQGIDYNLVYKFVAKEDTWFKQGTEAFLEWWFLPENIDIDKLMSLQELQSQGQYRALFRGLRQCQGQFKGKPIGQIYSGSEFCSLDEFQISYRQE